MKLKAPYTGVAVEAEGELAKRLMARGFAPEPKKEDAPKRARNTRKRD